jgi:hypothetical protein
MYDINFLKVTKSILKGQHAKFHLVDFLYSLGLEFATLKSHQNVQEIFMQKKC